MGFNSFRVGPRGKFLWKRMEAVCSSETKVNFYQTTLHSIPEHNHLNVNEISDFIKSRTFLGQLSDVRFSRRPQLHAAIHIWSESL
jgi:hypothetical protein